MVKIRTAKWLVIICLAAFVVFCAAFPGSVRRIRQHIDDLFGYVPVATFGKYDFVGYDKFRRLEYEAGVGVDGQSIYIQINDDGVHRLDEIEESVIAKAIPIREDRFETSLARSYFNDECIFIFKDNRLYAARISYSRDGLFKVGPTPEGPFRELPMEYSEAFEMFGQPDRWGRTRVITSP